MEPGLRESDCPFGTVQKAVKFAHVQMPSRFHRACNCSEAKESVRL